MQFVNESTDIPIEKVAHRVEDLADTEKTMELLRYIVNLYLLVESIFSIHVTPRATVRVANICSVFPAFFQQIIRTQRKTRLVRPKSH